MRPVLEKRTVLFEEFGQVLAPIGLVAGKQDLVMGALDGADAVDLDEADVLDQLQQAGFVERAVGWRRQP